MAHHRAAALFSSAVKRVNLVANCNSVPALLDTLDSTRPATCQMLSGFPLKISYETPTLCTTVGKRKPAAGWQTNGNPDTENTQLLCTEVLPSFCASQHHCTPCTTAKLIMAELNRKYLKALSSSFSVRTLILSRMVHVPSLTAGLWPKDTQVIWCVYCEQGRFVVTQNKLGIWHSGKAAKELSASPTVFSRKEIFRGMLHDSCCKAI